MEKKCLAQMIKFYKENKCLWDPRDISYIDKPLKEKTFLKLLELYRKVQPCASKRDLRKRLDNMRAAYNRERKKVIQSRLENEEHRPTLWYYHHFDFLDELYDDPCYGVVSVAARNINLKRGTSLPPSDYIPEKTEALSEPEDDSEEGHVDFLEENVEYLDTTIDNSMPSEEVEEVKQINISSVTAIQSFGATIGLQLKDLDPLQQVIAEKLISEVIFNARLQKLNTESRVLLEE